MEDILPGKGQGIIPRPDPAPGVETEAVLDPPVRTRGPQGMARGETTLLATLGEMPASLLEEPLEDTSTPPRTGEAALTLEQSGVDPAGQILAS